MNSPFKIATDAPPRMLASFRLDDAWYGLDALLIQEVVRLRDCTPVPSAAHFVTGILNLRGKIVTVLDLKARLGLPPADAIHLKPILVIPFRSEQVGLLIDEIDDVIEIDPSRLEALPANVEERFRPFFRAVHRCEDRLITVLDPLPIIDLELSNASAG